MGYRYALAGNPNCGKTTLFNAVTGSNQYVGNWPGVTVEKRKAKSPMTIWTLPLSTCRGFIRFRLIPWRRLSPEIISSTKNRI